MNTLTQFAQEVSASASDIIWAKSVGAGVALAAAALGLAWVGASYMKALGRNPEAGKAAGQIIIVAAMIEVTALLTFLLAAFLITE